MIVRSRAPLRIGLAGGGTDTSPYSDLYGGSILNATIDKFAYATIIPRTDHRIVLHALDRGIRQELIVQEQLELEGDLKLHRGVYNRLMREFPYTHTGFELHTYVDVPPGSGLGSSSTLVAAMIGVFTEWQNLPLGEYDIAYLAYKIERLDCGFEGGKQDQFAATFGGINFMEFNGKKVIVNPLRVRAHHYLELEHNLLLYYTGTSRLSSVIIRSQTQNVEYQKAESLDAMHILKEQSLHMKEALLRGNLDQMGLLLDEGWKTKKKLSDKISNPKLEHTYQTAKQAGATGGKISGAGGGGFLTLYCPQNTRYQVDATLKKLGGEVLSVKFSPTGLISWTIT